MEFRISGRHLEVTQPIADYARRKTERLPRFYDRIQEVTVVIDQHDRQFDVEIVTHVDRHDPIVARQRGDDLYACIDEAAAKAERQLTDHKDRLRNRKHHPA